MTASLLIPSILTAFCLNMDVSLLSVSVFQFALQKYLFKADSWDHNGTYTCYFFFFSTTLQLRTERAVEVLVSLVTMREMIEQCGWKPNTEAKWLSVVRVCSLSCLRKQVHCLVLCTEFTHSWRDFLGSYSRAVGQAWCCHHWFLHCQSQFGSLPLSCTGQGKNVFWSSSDIW